MHPDQMTNHWNYSDEDPLGPSEWPKYFETGDSQSPINIIVDHCYLHLHSSTNSTTMTPMMTTKPAGSRGKLVAGMAAARRDHLDSVGDDLNNSPQYSPDLYDDNHLNVHHHHHHDRRSPSASSNNSSVSNESNTSNEPTTEHSGAHHHNRHHHHHHERHHERHRRHQQHHSAYQRDDDSPKPRQHHQTEHRLCHHGDQAPAANTQNTRYCGTNKKIFLGYPRYLNAVKISNTGHGWQIDMPAELACHTLLTGPPLGDREYRLAQFHCHWGEDCEHGSEHQVNGQGFSAEIHFVHWNCKQFKSIEEASKHKHGLAVLGVFIQALEGEQNRNKHLDKIIAGLEEVQDRPHNSTLLSDIRLDLKKLFPSNRWNYATYEGSLTTPPLSECVDWLVFLQPITCSSSQIDQFRRIKCPTGTLTKNCRPVQPVNKRIVTIWTHHSDNPNN